MNGPAAPRADNPTGVSSPVWSAAAMEAFPVLEPQDYITTTKKRSGLGWREFFSRLGNGTLPFVKQEA